MPSPDISLASDSGRSVSDSLISPEHNASSMTPSIAVCIPAHNEASTIGAICRAVSSELMGGRAPFVSELVVIDDRSEDDTASQARDNGARVVPVAKILPRFQPDKGKGNAMWKAIAATTADIVVFCDGDLEKFDTHYVTALAEMLLADESLVMTKGYYERIYEGDPNGGGRTTALMARPALSLFFPHLARINQPLGGEYAIRRAAAEQVPFVRGWGVEVGLLIDVAARWGADAIGQAELGKRTHKHRPLHELSIQASEILHIVLQRAGVPWQKEWSSLLVRQEFEDLRIKVEEMPPLISVSEYADLLAGPDIDLPADPPPATDLDAA